MTWFDVTATRTEGVFQKFGGGYCSLWVWCFFQKSNANTSYNQWIK